MNLLETVRATRAILDRRTQRTLLLATVLTVVIALFDTFAIALVLPLVTLATGDEDITGVGGVFASVLGDPDPQTLLVTMTVTVVAMFILKDLGALAFTWWLSGFKAFRRVDLSTRLLGHFLRMPYTEVSRRSTAELLRTMNDAVMQFYGTTVFGLMTLVSNVASLGAIALALVLSAPLPSLALGLYFTLAAFFYLQVMKPRLQVAGTVSAEASSAAYRTAFAALGGLKEAKLRGSQHFFVEGYRDAALRGARAARSAGFISAAPRYLLEVLFILAIGVLLLAGMTTGGGRSPAISLMALFVAAGLRALPAVTSMMGQVSNLRYGAGFLDVVLQEVRIQQRVDSTSEGTHVCGDALELKDRITLEEVSFHYPGSREAAVREVDLVVERGRSVAIVGGSGAGKTTLIDLVLGLHRPSHGRVTVDGQDIQAHLQAWQRSIGYVPQEVFLREATLAENVAFDRVATQIDPSRLRKAVELAQLDDVVAALDDGLETQIGERGSRLSGGQRQRIGIARALYQQPQLLVLDEATSALDNETEHEVSEAIRRLNGELTVIIVAHRLSTVRHVDTIVLMHDGHVETSGSFDQVRRTSPRFRRMVELGSLT